jgi:hypothetical protein
MKKLFGIFLIALISLLSCQSYKEIKDSGLKTAFILNSSSTFKGYYYTGSDNQYHYFLSKWRFERNKYFKIAIVNLRVVDDLKFVKDQKELRIDLLNESNALFAENEYCKLYVYGSK